MIETRERSYKDIYPEELWPFVPARIPVWIPGIGVTLIVGVIRRKDDHSTVILECQRPDGRIIRHAAPYEACILN